MPKPASLTARVVNDRDEPVFDTTSALTPSDFALPDRSADYRLALPLSTLCIGQYLLTFDATVDRQTVSRHVRFRIEN